MLHLDSDSLDRSDQAARVHALSGGSPLLARAIVEDDEWRAGFDFADAADGQAGPLFRDAVLSLLRRCGPAAFDVARGIALLGPDASLASLSRLLDVPEAGIVHQARTLERAGLVGNFTFRHPAVAGLVLGTGLDLPTSARTLSAVDLLMRLCAEPVPGLDGAAPTGQDGAPDWASRVLSDAVDEHASASDRPSSHVCGLLLRALATVDPVARQQCLKEIVVHLLARGGRRELTLTPHELRQSWLTRQTVTEHEPTAVGTDCSGERDAVLGALTDETGRCPVETSHELSDAERRVAELAAGGLTNREISRQLWITVSTVEQHLTRIYRKLGVSGRGNIGAAYAALAARGGISTA